MAVKTFLVRSRGGSCREVDFEDIHADLSITNSVGVGGVNRAEDVRSIQQALNQVPPASGGPAPPLVVDGLSGDLTDKAIATFQRRSLGFADGRVDPAGPTIRKLQEFGSADGPDRHGGVSASAKKKKTVSAAPCTDPITSQNIMDLVFDPGVSEALRWILRAQIALDQARDDLVLPNVVRRFSIIGPGKGTKLVNKYFHLDKLPKARRLGEITRMHLLFTTMRTAIGHNAQSPNRDAGRSSGFLQPDPCCVNSQDKDLQTALGYTFPGGFTAKNAKTGKPRLSKEDNYSGPNLREDTIFFCTGNLLNADTFGVELLAVTLIHELAHFCGPEKGAAEIDDHEPPGDDVTKLSAAQALHNAESYAQFAGEAALGREVIQ
jgi:peptidoglycan hydrolase-like protein with peptidoglycan-binding domain